MNVNLLLLGPINLCSRDTMGVGQKLKFALHFFKGAYLFNITGIEIGLFASANTIIGIGKL